MQLGKGKGKSKGKGKGKGKADINVKLMSSLLHKIISAQSFSISIKHSPYYIGVLLLLHTILKVVGNQNYFVLL